MHFLQHIFNIQSGFVKKKYSGNLSQVRFDAVFQYHFADQKARINWEKLRVNTESNAEM